MLFLNTLSIDDEKWSEQMNRWIDLLNMMQSLQSQILKINSKEEKRDIGKVFSVKKDDIAKDFRDLKKLNTVEVTWGCEVKVKKRN